METKNLIKLSDYLKGKRNYSINMVENYVNWKNECHKIVYKQDTAYVQIRQALPLSIIRDMVLKINKKKYKNKLKGQHITINGNVYLITGIGGEAIKASKNSGEQEFYRYVGTRKKNIESQEILETLYKLCDTIDQQTAEEK